MIFAWTTEISPSKSKFSGEKRHKARSAPRALIYLIQRFMFWLFFGKISTQFSNTPWSQPFQSDQWFQSVNIGIFLICKVFFKECFAPFSAHWPDASSFEVFAVLRRALYVALGSSTGWITINMKRQIEKLSALNYRVFWSYKIGLLNYSWLIVYYIPCYQFILFLNSNI